MLPLNKTHLAVAGTAFRRSSVLPKALSRGRVHLIKMGSQYRRHPVPAFFEQLAFQFSKTMACLFARYFVLRFRKVPLTGAAALHDTTA